MTGAYEKVDAHRPPPQDTSDNSDLDEESEGNYDSSRLRRKRPSAEVRRRDEKTLETEEEAERLLASKERVGLGELFGRADSSKPVHDDTGEKRRIRRGSRMQSRRQSNGEESELMYEMEEARRRESAESSGHSSESDLQKLGEVQTSRQSRKSLFARFTAIHVVIVAAFVGLLYGAYKASHFYPAPPETLKRLSNGTSTFLPTTILISLDGFRADFLQRNLTPTLNSFITSGVSPRYMLPSFPSLTFPNHYTLVTGVYPESHGIVGNTFWDPNSLKEFYYTDPDRSMQPEWWLSEPLWETAELQGVRSAIHMWPGSEAHIGRIEPYYVDRYDGNEVLDKKVDRVLELLDLPGPEDIGAKADQPRPQLIAAYVPDVDADGHLYGPNSTEIRGTIANVDVMLGKLFTGIDERNLTSILNIIVVSDHGMATTSVSRLIQLEDLIETSLIEHIDGWPLYGLRPKDSSDEAVENVYQILLAQSRLPQYWNSFDVYLRDMNMPDRYHFTASPRIAPVWIVPKTGWAIVTKNEFDVAEGIRTGKVYHPRGLHGYDHEHPLMRAIFVARGPAFPHKPGSRLAEFQNTEVYNIVCDSLGLEPRPNNGTLRLPLQTIGLHDESPEDELPHDPPKHADESDEQPPEVENLNFGLGPVIWESSIPTAESTVAWIASTLEDGSLALPTNVPAGNFGIATAPAEPPPQPTRLVVHDSLAEEEDDQQVNHWWDWVKGKLGGIKDWAVGAFGPDSAENGTSSVGNGTTLR